MGVKMVTTNRSKNLRNHENLFFLQKPDISNVSIEFSAKHHEESILTSKKEVVRKKIHEKLTWPPAKLIWPPAKLTWPPAN